MNDAADLTGIRYSYDGGVSWALDGVDLTVQAGEYLCLTGTNGSGKSTLARLIAGLAAPDAGDITLLGHHVFSLGTSDGSVASTDSADKNGSATDEDDSPDDATAGSTAESGFGANPAEYRAARRGIGAVFQNPEDQLVTTISEDDVAFGPENLGLDRSSIGSRIDESLNAVDMAAHRFDDPTRMSGGQQQRVAIAGMLAMHPSMLVLDEPTAMLDPAARAEVMRILDDLHAQGTTIVHVTHHDDEVSRATRVVRLEHGRIVADAASSPSAPVVSAGQVPSAISTKQSGHIISTEHRSPVISTERSERRNLPQATTPEDFSTSLRSARNDDDMASGNNTTADDAIVVSHVTYQYPGADILALDDLSLTVKAGEVVAIMGENGAGKSTLARLICALEKPQHGSISVAGIPVATDPSVPADSRTITAENPDGSQSHHIHTRRSPRTLGRKQRETLRRTVGFVMQHPERQLFADTVAEDVAYGPRNQRLSESEVSARVDEAMRLLHIEDLADRSPFSLSGGQQRLAAIAGVIACRPKVLVMDEPTASLDAAATARIHELIRTLRAQGVTVLIITHSFDEAQAVAYRIVMLPANASDRGSSVPSVARAASTSNKFAAQENRGHREHGSSSVAPEQYPSAGPVTQSPSIVPVERSSSVISTERRERSNLSSPDIPTDSVQRDITSTSAHPARAASSFIAKLDPRVKMVAFLAMMFTAFAINTPAQLALGAALVAGIVTASRINPLRLLASVHMFLTMFVVMGALNIFFVRTGTTLAQLGPIPITDDGVTIAILYALRFALVIILGAVMLETTTPTELTDGFGSLLSPLSKLGVHTQEIALVMSLALRFLPTLGAEAKAIADAQAARSGSIETGSPTARLKAMTALCVPMFAGAIRHADNLSLALDARCYEEGVRRTHWHELRIRPADLAFATITVIYIAVLVALPLI
ncbi:energy-coupling factor transporter ATPase [Bifidobacterium aerophilum]|uniref:ATP-binding cassette domain-containing protein n=1 Tax=Bifidobacterium aerophilum TaxID=1798155 RepID=A0A6N9Z221_9BIFI|nr:energy-coupling factor transporter ATPase [Bifidobacterium aerophilum]NEG88659.1 ATP-binding cassette domain-containing protein [Bifidobacterium aerophilum]